MMGRFSDNEMLCEMESHFLLKSFFPAGIESNAATSAGKPLKQDADKISTLIH